MMFGINIIAVNNFLLKSRLSAMSWYRINEIVIFICTVGLNLIFSFLDKI